MLTVEKEFQYRSNGQDYYKVFVAKNGMKITGTRTIDSFAGSTLKRVISNKQQDIKRGAWAEK